jgi:hypothetical protein
MEPSIISVPLLAGIAAIPKPNVLSIPLAHKQLLLKQPLPTPAEHSSQPVKPKWSRLLVTHLPARTHRLVGAVVTIEVVEDMEVLDAEILDVPRPRTPSPWWTTTLGKHYSFSWIALLWVQLTSQTDAPVSFNINYIENWCSRCLF